MLSGSAVTAEQEGAGVDYSTEETGRIPIRLRDSNTREYTRIRQIGGKNGKEGEIAFCWKIKI